MTRTAQQATILPGSSLVPKGSVAKSYGDHYFRPVAVLSTCHRIHLRPVGIRTEHRLRNDAFTEHRARRDRDDRRLYQLLAIRSLRRVAFDFDVSGDGRDLGLRRAGLSRSVP